MTDNSDYERKLIEIVDEHGWQFNFVFDPDGIEPDFGYSVGFSTSLDAPEFVVFGLPKNLMSAMIWEVFYQIEKGMIPKDNMRLSGLIDGSDCIIRKAIHPDLYKEYAVSSQWYWSNQGKTGSPEVYQIVWPGAQQGLFPWEDGCVQDVIDAQPHLWLGN